MSAELRRVGRQIAERRKALAWTQEQLAEKVGVSARYVQSVEAGGENLTIDSLAKIARALRGSLGDVFHWTPVAARASERRRR